MATSSLFKTFTIKGPVEVENFVKMLDEEPQPIPPRISREVTG